MTRTSKTILALILIVLIGGAAVFGYRSFSDSDGEDGQMFQVSTLGSLNEGNFEGVMSYGDLKEHGDFGLGTFDALDGEMVAVDGDYYQVREDGVAYPVEDDMTTPFAAVMHFDGNISGEVDVATGCSVLEMRIDDLLDDGVPYGILVEGEFNSVLTRSEAAQEEPYPALEDALADQVEFELTDVEGRMVGFRLPDYMDELNAPGYHFHFITADERAGGHVLDCQVADVDISADEIEEWRIELPSNEAE